MRLDQIPTPSQDISVTARRPGDLSDLPLMAPIKTEATPAGVIISSAGHRASVTIDNPAEQNQLISALGREGAQISAVVARDEIQAVIRTWRFARALNYQLEKLNLLLDHDVIATMAAQAGKALTDNEVKSRLDDQFLIGGFHDPLPRIIVRMHPSTASVQNGFTIVGATRQLDVRALGRTLEAVRWAPLRDQRSLATILLTCDFAFETNLQAAPDSTLAVGAILSNDQYMKRWSRYGDAELAVESERAEQLGQSKFVHSELLTDGTWRFDLAGGSPLLQGLSTDMSLGVVPPVDRGGGQNDRFTGEVTAWDAVRRSVTLRPFRATMEAPRAGTLEYGLGGSNTSHRRRVTAAYNLMTGNVPMPELGAMLEGRHRRASRIDRRYSWDSPATRSVFGNNEPTPAQKKAIEVALNTPDIAIIQGPPGTGKTQVISAIAARVAEVLREGGSVGREVLLTSFQHDAVDNVASRTTVFGLPTIKETARDRGSAWLTQWRRDRLHRADELFNNIEQGQLGKKFESLKERRTAYLQAPVSDASIADFFDDVRRDVGDQLSVKLQEELREQAERWRHPHATTEKDTNVIARVRALRTTVASHPDDGLDNALRLLTALPGNRWPQGIDRLPIQVASNLRELDEEQLAAVEQIKRELLDHYVVMRLKTRLPTRNADVVALFDSAINEINLVLEQDGAGLANVLNRFISDLDTDRQGVELALAEYSAVVAATCQAASSLAARPEAVELTSNFDTVIVDEAARANPLDLQIPMSIARRRVILVGDQRQLPHLIDDEIAQSVVSGPKEVEELEESLFSRLFRFLHSERAGGMPDRVVTLNQQFRMHPLLGDFVSDSFYKPFGEHIESPRPATDFAHNLPGYEPRVAAWLDVPAKDGREMKIGTGRSRPVEAEVIAREVKRLAEAAPELTFGVITFYRHQVTAILEELYQLGLAGIDHESGEIAITSDQWRFTVDDKGESVERLRVGTVDAFQGKEFDVALLSCVRTPVATTDKPNHAFGHLRIMNRLNVAMSRQRRLLVLVGDREGLAHHPLAREHVAPIAAFSELCQAEERHAAS